MRSPLRALLLALVMVAQTIAGGLGVAHAGPGGELAFAAHCETAGQDGNAAGGAPAGGHQHCDSCCLCSAPQAAALPAGGAILRRSHAFHAVHFVLSEAREVFDRLTQAQSARGPPATVRV